MKLYQWVGLGLTVVGMSATSFAQDKSRSVSLSSKECEAYVARLKEGSTRTADLAEFLRHFVQGVASSETQALTSRMENPVVAAEIAGLKQHRAAAIVLLKGLAKTKTTTEMSFRKAILNFASVRKFPLKLEIVETPGQPAQHVLTLLPETKQLAIGGRQSVQAANTVSVDFSGERSLLEQLQPLLDDLKAQEVPLTQSEVVNKQVLFTSAKTTQTQDYPSITSEQELMTQLGAFQQTKGFEAFAFRPEEKIKSFASLARAYVNGAMRDPKAGKAGVIPGLEAFKEDFKVRLLQSVSIEKIPSKVKGKPAKEVATFAVKVDENDQQIMETALLTQSEYFAEQRSACQPVDAGASESEAQTKSVIESDPAKAISDPPPANSKKGR